MFRPCDCWRCFVLVLGGKGVVVVPRVSEERERVVVRREEDGEGRERTARKRARRELLARHRRQLLCAELTCGSQRFARSPPDPTV
eukprot:2248630-Rhodomonas_salina.1